MPILRLTYCLCASILILGACSGGLSDEFDPGAAKTGSVETTPAMSHYSVDPALVENVLADGEVTFDELSQAYQAVFGCLLDAGIDGVVAYNLELEGSYASELRALDPEMEIEQYIDIILGCESSIEEIERVYRDPPTAETAEAMRKDIIECVHRDAPEVASGISEDWDLETLRVWLSSDEVAEEYGRVAPAAGDCVVSRGMRWIPLAEAAGRE